MARGKNVENKKKPQRVAAGPEAAGFARSMGENIGRVIRPMLPLAIFFALTAGFSILLWRSFGVANAASPGLLGDNSAFRLSDKTLRQAILQKPRPTWVSREDFEQVASFGAFAAGRSIFEPNLSSTLAARYRLSSWVGDVREVRLRYPAQLEVDIEWRRPAARVDRSMVVDGEGWVLNLMPDNPVVREIPVITGVSCMRTETGKRIQEKDIRDALKLIVSVKDALDRSPGQLRVTTSQREPNGEWRVITDRGPAIFWGKYTDDPPMDEPHTQEKVDLLRRRLCEVKDPSLLEYVKVYTAQAPVKPRVVAAEVPAVKKK